MIIDNRVMMLEEMSKFHSNVDRCHQICVETHGKIQTNEDKLHLDSGTLQKLEDKVEKLFEELHVVDQNIQ